MAKAVAKAGMKNKPRQDEDEDGDDDDEDDAPKAKSKVKPAESKFKSKSKDVDEDDDDEADNEDSADDDDDDAPKAKSKDKAKTKAKSKSSDDDDEDGEDGDDEDDDDDEVIDLSAEEEGAAFNDEVVPAGNYTCEVVKTDFKVYKTGSKGMLVRLQVVEGPYAKSKTNKVAKSFFTNVVMTKEAGGMLKTNLKALGAEKKVWNSKAFKPSMLRELADGGELLGNRVKARIAIRMYEGNKQNEVKRLTLVNDDVAEGDGDYMEE